MANKADSAPLSFKEKVGYGVGDMASNFYLGFLVFIYFITTPTCTVLHLRSWE